MANPENVELRDEDGLPLAGHPDLQAALVKATLAFEVVLDGYLIALPPLDASGVFAGAADPQAPGLGASARQLFVGSRPPGRRLQSAPAALFASMTAEATATTLAFVAVDILAIDGGPLLDVPLLERKRLLDGVLAVGELVRRSPHVRPPIGPWYSQWRAFGFREIAVKAVNSRYLPGEPSDDWAVARIPNA